MSLRVLMTIDEKMFDRCNKLLAIDNLYHLSEEEKKLNPAVSEDILVSEEPIELSCGKTINLRLYLLSTDAYYFERWEAYYYDTLVGYEEENEYCIEDDQEIYLGSYIGEVLPPTQPSKYPKDENSWKEDIREIRKELVSETFYVEISF